jgi:hypothetical protein
MYGENGLVQGTLLETYFAHKLFILLSNKTQATMQIFVKTLTGKTITLEVKSKLICAVDNIL